MTRHRKKRIWNWLRNKNALCYSTTHFNKKLPYKTENNIFSWEIICLVSVTWSISMSYLVPRCLGCYVPEPDKEVTAASILGWFCSVDILVPINYTFGAASILGLCISSHKVHSRSFSNVNIRGGDNDHH